MKKVSLAILLIVLAIGMLLIFTSDKGDDVSSGVKTTMTLTDETGEVISKRKVRLVNREKVKSKFYEARTVDECINEQACLWKAFSSFTTIYKDCNDCVVHKWDQPIQIRIMGSEQEEHTNAVKDFVETVKPNISVPINFSDEPNFLVIFSDNIDRDVYGKYKEYLSDFYDWDLFIDEYEKSKLMSQLDINDHRRLFKATPFYADEKSFEKYAVFIDVNDSSWTDYLNRRLFTGLGFISNSYWMTGIAGYDSDETGELKQKLIEILYSSKIKSGQAIGEIKENFSAVIAN